jgi:uncharacterized protein (TIGR02452 family)
MSLASIAAETLSILESGTYVAPSGRSISISREVAAAIRGTVLVRPGDSDLPRAPAREGAITFEVTEETTAAAARRLVADLGVSHVALLNFASAKNPGGGFSGGAKAQEEDLARASALYPCLRTQRDFYALHRATPSLLYSDHVIYSPAVPFFRDDRLDLLEEPFLASVLTAAAPNAGEVLRRDANAGAAIAEAIVRRARRVLEVAASRGHRSLVLGAWGCGVFRNDPGAVADAFARWLGDAHFSGAFERVVFAIYDRSARKENLAAFRERFS